jgi:SAM-dependent methyltransferase
MATKKIKQTSAGWDAVAGWYNGWMGEAGSKHHRNIAIPAVLDLLALRPGEKLLDLGAGQGVLAPYVAERGTDYTGVEISPRLLEYARRMHGKSGRFVHGDVTRLPQLGRVPAKNFDAAVFLLSLQDINPLQGALAGAAWALKPGGRLVLFLTHPCFRVPRQSGWGWDDGRKLRFRRVDSYLSALAVPMKSYAADGNQPPKKEGSGTTVSYHRPLEEYINSLADCGFLVERIKEIPTYKEATRGEMVAAENRANQEIPLFLAIRARLG